MKELLRKFDIKKFFIFVMICAIIVFGLIISKYESGKCSYFDCFGVIEWALSVPAILFMIYGLVMFCAAIYNSISSLFKKRK